MSEDLKNHKPRVLQLNFKVNEDEMNAVQKFVNDRDWKMAAFIRVAMKKEMARLEKEGK